MLDWLEDHVECWLLNARHLRNVPGRKTDVDTAGPPARSWPRSPADRTTRSDESAGKTRSGRIRRGSVWLRTELRIAAKAAVRTKGTYLAAHHAQIKVLARDAISEPQADAA